MWSKLDATFDHVLLDDRIHSVSVNRPAQVDDLARDRGPQVHVLVDEPATEAPHRCENSPLVPMLRETH